jgi:hypothetical protein
MGTPVHCEQTVCLSFKGKEWPGPGCRQWRRRTCERRGAPLSRRGTGPLRAGSQRRCQRRLRASSERRRVLPPGWALPPLRRAQGKALQLKCVKLTSVLTRLVSPPKQTYDTLLSSFAFSFNSRHYIKGPGGGGGGGGGGGAHPPSPGTAWQILLATS